MPVIGFLNGFSLAEWADAVAAFHKGLNETGYVEGRNVAIEYRWAEGQSDRLPALAAELVRRQVTVLVTTGGSTTARAAKAATSTIPIIFGVGTDPIKLGVVASLSRPGGNASGVYFLTNEMEAKRLGLLRELVPKAAVIAILLNPSSPNFEGQSKDLREAAGAVGQQVRILHASSERELDTAFATVDQLRAAALLVGANVFFNAHRDRIVALAARHAIPAIYEQREFALAGGLMSYGTSLPTPRARSASTPGGSLRARDPPTCRWCNRPSLSS